MLHEQPADVFVHRSRADGLDEFDAAIPILRGSARSGSPRTSPNRV
jgi:hypothetical protein